jgi:hypothetical protein
MALSAHLARSSSSPGALPPRPWPNEVALEWRVLQDSRAAACAVADALQAREHEQAALCGSWPLPWAELRAVQGPGGLAAELLEDSTDSVGPGGRDARGNLLPEQLVAVRGGECLRVSRQQRRATPQGSRTPLAARRRVASSCARASSSGCRARRWRLAARRRARGRMSCKMLWKRHGTLPPTSTSSSRQTRAWPSCSRCSVRARPWHAEA